MRIGKLKRCDKWEKKHAKCEIWNENRDVRSGRWELYDEDFITNAKWMKGNVKWKLRNEEIIDELCETKNGKCELRNVKW